MRSGMGMSASTFGVYPSTWEALNTEYPRVNSRRELDSVSPSCPSADSCANFQNTTVVAFSPLRTWAPRSCRCWYVAHSPRSQPLAWAAAQRHTVFIPRYGFLLTTLMGEKTNLPDVCQGMRHEPTPFSIAVMIWAVTLA